MIIHKDTVMEPKPAEAILREKKIALRDVMYLGNDLNDLECIERVGCGVAVRDASPEVRRKAKIVLKRKGGQGAVRELCDGVLRVLR